MAHAAGAGAAGATGDAAAPPPARVARPRAQLAPSDIAEVVLPHATGLRWLEYSEDPKSARKDVNVLCKHQGLFRAPRRGQQVRACVLQSSATCGAQRRGVVAMRGAPQGQVRSVLSDAKSCALRLLRGPRAVGFFGFGCRRPPWPQALHARGNGNLAITRRRLEAALVLVSESRARWFRADADRLDWAACMARRLQLCLRHLRQSLSRKPPAPWVLAMGLAPTGE